MMADRASCEGRGTFGRVDGPEISDEELTALALAADPDAALDDDAVPFGGGADDDDPDALLPAWYMPRAVRHGRRRHRLVIAGIIGALLVVNGAGLCVTYGIPQIAW
jgi:hypothetical protein